jgi:hypothetical protein
MVTRATKTCSWILMDDTPNVIIVRLLVNIQTFHMILFRLQAVEYSVKSAQFYHTTKGVTLQKAESFKRTRVTVTAFVVLIPCNQTMRRHSTEYHNQIRGPSKVKSQNMSFSPVFSLTVSCKHYLKLPRKFCNSFYTSIKINRKCSVVNFKYPTCYSSAEE